MRKIITIASLTVASALVACEEPNDPKGRDDDELTDEGEEDDDGDRPGDPGKDSSKDDKGPVTGDPGSTKAAHFFLPTGEPKNTAAPVVEIDASGGTHTLYPAYIGGGAFYGFCQAGGCRDKSDVQMVQFPTEGTVGSAMLALTADGKPRILLSTLLHLYYGTCDANCGELASWKLGEILTFNGDLAVNGQALALDPAGRPRFLVHGERNPFYPFTPRHTETRLASCDADCHLAASWRYGTIAAKEIWDYPSLRYDAQGKAHVATILFDYGENPGQAISAYLWCTGTCDAENTWTGAGLLPHFESSTEAVTMTPAITLALTRAGQPRVAMIAKTPEGQKRLAYLACDSSCERAANWSARSVFDAAAINAGVDLALDANDRPRIAHTMNYDIVISYCDSANCTAEDSGWDSSYVEQSKEIPADTIFLEWNCTVGAWFLHSPSIALSADGKPTVGYQSRDVSGGVSRPDPTKPRCVAGTDMTFSRLAVLPSYKMTP